MIKLFVTDIDGTLLTNKYEYRNGISDRNIEALDKLRSNNIHIVVASGRFIRYLSLFDKHKGFQEDTVANNGAYIYFNKRIIYRKLFSKDKIRMLLKDFPEIKHKLMFSDIDGMKVFHNHSNAINKPNKNIPIPYGIEIIPLQGMEEFMTSSEWLPPAQIHCNFDNEKETHSYLDLFNKKYQGKITAVNTDPNTIDLVCDPASKSHGIQIITKRLGIKEQEVAVIGDSFNDIDMFNMFKDSFCMLNAKDEVKKHAKIIVGSVHQAVDIVLEKNRGKER